MLVSTLLLVFMKLSKGLDPRSVSACHGDPILLQCPPGQQIHILKEVLGFSASKRCHRSPQDECVMYGPTSARHLCNGKNRCDLVQFEQKICPRQSAEHTTYQEIEFICAQGSSVVNICSNTSLSVKSGYLSSPGHPGTYPATDRCHCIINSTRGNKVYMDILKLDIKHGRPCHDWLGLTPSDGQIERICGAAPVERVTRNVTVEFHSEDEARYRGFWLYFQVLPDDSEEELLVLCNNAIQSKSFRNISNHTPKHLQSTVPSKTTPKIHKETNTRRRLTTPSLPTTTQDLGWARHVLSVSGCFGQLLSFRCEFNERIRVLTDVYGRGTDGACAYHDGDCIVENDVEHSHVVRLCGGRHQCNNLIVNHVFCKEHVTEYQYVEYQCVPESVNHDICQQGEFFITSGFLESPNYPNLYDPGRKCSCDIYALENTEVKVEILDMVLQGAHCLDWVEIGNAGGNASQKVCGSGYGMLSALGKINILFSSQERTGDAKNFETQKGFWLHYMGSEERPLHVRCNMPASTAAPTLTSVITSTASPSTTTTTPSSPPITTSSTTSATRRLITVSRTRTTTTETTPTISSTVVSRLLQNIKDPVLTKPSGQSKSTPKMAGTTDMTQNVTFSHDSNSTAHKVLNEVKTSTTTASTAFLSVSVVDSTTTHTWFRRLRPDHHEEEHVASPGDDPGLSIGADTTAILTTTPTEKVNKEHSTSDSRSRGIHLVIKLWSLVLIVIATLFMK